MIPRRSSELYIDLWRRIPPSWLWLKERWFFDSGRGLWLLPPLDRTAQPAMVVMSILGRKVEWTMEEAPWTQPLSPA